MKTPQRKSVGIDAHTSLDAHADMSTHPTRSPGFRLLNLKKSQEGTPRHQTHRLCMANNETRPRPFATYLNHLLNSRKSRAQRMFLEAIKCGLEHGGLYLLECTIHPFLKRQGLSELAETLSLLLTLASIYKMPVHFYEAWRGDLRASD